MPKSVFEASEVQRLVDAGAQLLEVLPREEYESEHLVGAIHIPLRKLDAVASRVPSPVAMRNPAAASLYIVPAGGRDSLFSTHPSTERRIERLREIAATMGQTSGWTSPPGAARGHMPPPSGTVPSAGSIPRRAGPWG